MDQNIDFTGSDQIQTPQYPEIHPPSQEISDEVFQAKGDLMKSIHTFLEEFNYIPFEEKPEILLQAWYKFFAIQYAQPVDSNELFQKLLEDLQIINKELIECNRPTFFDDNEEHYVQYKENLENSLNSNQEKEGPPQDSDIHQLIREKCCIEVYEEQRQKMENTILELVEICRQKELYCMHDNVDDLIESALNFKLLLINSQRLNKEKQEVKNVVEQPVERRTLAPILSTKEPEYSPSMGYENPNTTLETKSDEIIKTGVKELVPILSENEVTSEDKREVIDDDAFEDIEYVKESLPDQEIVSLAEENDVNVEEKEVDVEDMFQIQDIILCEKLLSINRLIANIESLNENPTPDCVLNSSVSFLISEVSDNSSPEFETFCDNTEETRSGNTTTHADDSLSETIFLMIRRMTLFWKKPIYFLLPIIRYHRESDFNNPSVPLPPPEPPDAEIDFEIDAGEEIPVVMNDNDELECLDPRDEFDDDDYSSFMFVIYFKVFSFLLSTESEDTIFYPGISV
nr:hypothetical protein [Tanacetum cinerariifolium]